MANTCRFDKIYRKLLLTKFFVKGWGKPETLNQIVNFRKILSDKYKCYSLVDPNTPINITKTYDEGQVTIMEGQFPSPLDKHLPHILPERSKMAYFQAVLPRRYLSGDYRPVCIHLAGTGDHGFWRRQKFLAKPLAEEHGIGSIILENPFYGKRKPKEQLRSSLLNVSDLFVMGGALILECAVLLHWASREGHGPLALTGISMGGHMASLAACSWPLPVALIPCLSWTSASGVFTQGVLSGAINWQLLKNQYFANKFFREELFNSIHSPEGHYGVYNDLEKDFASETSANSANDFSSANFNNRCDPILNCRDDSFGSLHDESLDGKISPASFSENSTFSEQIIGKRATRENDTVHDNSTINTVLNSSENNSRSLRSKLSSYISPNTTGDKTQNRLVDRLFLYNKLSFKVDKNLIEKTDDNEDPNLKFKPVGIRPRNCGANSKQVVFKPYVRVRDSRTWEALQFMRALMDECTHVANFGKPTDDSLIICVQATKDAYEPHSPLTPLTDVWPRCELRSVPCGHVLAFIKHQSTFRMAIRDAIGKAYEQYGREGSWPQHLRSRHP